MQSWQIVMFVVVAGVFAASFVMRGKLAGKAAKTFGGGLQAFRGRLGLVSDEGAPICVVGTERKLMSGTVYWVALTTRRLFLEPMGGPLRNFDRASVRLEIARKTFSDTGNMATRVSTGWELQVELPGGERHALRVYEQAAGIPEHPALVEAMVHAVGT